MKNFVLLAFVFLVVGCGFDETNSPHAPQGVQNNSVDEAFESLKNHKAFASLIQSPECSSSNKFVRSIVFQAKVTRRVGDNGSYVIYDDSVILLVDAKTRVFKAIAYGKFDSMSYSNIFKGVSYKVKGNVLEVEQLGLIYFSPGDNSLVLSMKGADENVFLTRSDRMLTSSEDNLKYDVFCDVS